MEIYENNSSRYSGKLNLVGLFTNNRSSGDSDESDPRWKCTDFTRGHLLVMVILMATSYIAQLILFVAAVISLDPTNIHYHHVVTLIQPYFEIFEMMLIIFLVHFQFQAFYNEPFLILEIISRKLNYSNITITIMTSSIFLSSYKYASNFTEIYEMIVQITLLLMTTFVYYQMYQINKQTERRSLRQILGFNVLYSLSLSFTVIELTESIIIVASFNNSLQTTTADRTLISTSLYFLIGFAATFALQDVYIGMGACYNLLGIFVLQNNNI